MKTILMGQGSLALHCANALVAEGYQLIAVCSPDARVCQWAAQREIPVRSLRELESVEADYLFSVVNYRIVPASLLHRLRRFGINYHDALLPRYAGTHATTWAILNGERQHGITWHVMSDIVDGGDILKQTAFEIDAEETALSLNYKCFYAALQSFRELIVQLREGVETRTPQRLEERTYFPLNAKPNCLISFDQSAEDIDRLCRALHFGPHPNPIGAPKIDLSGTTHAVRSVRCTGTASERTPGTVIHSEEKELLIATASSDIKVTIQ